MADSTLTAIRNKVRRITRSPAEAQLTTAQLDQYINTFVLYDFPENLRLMTLKTTLTFYTTPNVDTYETNTTNPFDPLYQFKDRYVSVHPPVFIAGNQSVYLQSREQFFAIYPKVQSIQSIGTQGDGVTVNFTGTLSARPVLQNNVLFTSIDANNNGMTLYDRPIAAIPSTGNLYNSVGDPNVSVGTINYVTGAFNITFPNPPAANAQINSETLPYTAGQPQVLLYFDSKFQLRPVPDKPYSVQLEVYKRPTELLSAGQSPELEQWWVYLALGACRYVFQDRLDLESIQQLEPMFKEQEDLVLRTTVMQLSNQRTSTIYSDQAGYWPGNNYWGNFNNPS